MKAGSIISSLLLAPLLTGVLLTAPAAWAGTNQITGKITDESHHALAGMCVVAFGKPGPIVQSPATGSDGVYTVSNLDVTSWEVLAIDCTNSPATYSPVDHPNIKGLDDQVATFIKFTKDGTIHKNVNFKMPIAGHIAVTVLDCAPPNVPITGVDVCPIWFKKDHKHNTFQTGFCGFTSGPSADPSMDGKVLLDVTAGQNKVEVLTSPLIWSGDQPSFDTATIINVPAGGTVPVTVLANSPCGP
jgi:hypothetical protein